MGADEKKRKRQDDGGGKDSRFAAMHNDPRFARFPKAKRTVEIDNRFVGMFKDEDFLAKAAVDKRGRQVQPAKRTEDMKRYYRLRDEDEWKKDGVVAAEAQQTDDPEQSQAAALTPAAQAAVVATKQAAAPQPQVKGAKGKASKPQSAGVKQGAKAAAKDHSVVTGSATKASRRRAKGPVSGDEVEEEEDVVDAGEAAAVVGHEDTIGGGPEQEEEEAEDEEGGEQADDDPEEIERRAARERWARARGLVDVPGGSDDDDDDEGAADDYDSADEPLTEEEEEDVELDPAEWGAGALAANPDEPIPLTDETRRLALVDLDWDHVRACDVFAVLRSFVPPGGSLLRVTVYPSDYGLERMAQEATLGPQGIYQPAKVSAKPAAQSKGKDAEDGDVSAVDRVKLRMYEKSKLRYYYAVAEFDSISSALRVYNECDGMEFERSACKFDLRFVPDEQSFDGRQVRDTASGLPAEYEAPAVFNVALQHTDPKLSWDADDEGRKRKLSKKMTEDEIKESDFAAYLGSDDDGAGTSGDEDGAGGDQAAADALRERYRQLLTGGPTASSRPGHKSWAGGDDQGDDGSSTSGSGDDEDEGTQTGGRGGARRTKGSAGMEMEVTFMPGLDGLGERLLEKRRDAAARKDETVWTAYLRRRAEKKKLKKAQGKTVHVDDTSSDDSDVGAIGRGGAAGPDDVAAATVRDDPFFQHDEDPFSDPFFQDDDGATRELEVGPAGAAAVASSKQGTAAKGRPGHSAADVAAAKAEKQKAREVAAKKVAELELLMMDDSALRDAAKGVRAGRGRDAGLLPGGTANSQMEDEDDDGGRRGKAKKLSKKEKRQQKREAKESARGGSDEEDIGTGAGFAVNLEDPRFTEMFTSPAFAMDPTDPRLSKSGVGAGSAGQKAADMLKEVARRRSTIQAKLAKSISAEGPPQPSQPQAQAASEAPSDPSIKQSTLDKLDLRAMVAKLKKKGGAVDEPATSAAKAQPQKAKAPTKVPQPSSGTQLDASGRSAGGGDKKQKKQKKRGQDAP